MSTVTDYQAPAWVLLPRKIPKFMNVVIFLCFGSGRDYTYYYWQLIFMTPDLCINY